MARGIKKNIFANKISGYSRLLSKACLDVTRFLRCRIKDLGWTNIYSDDRHTFGRNQEKPLEFCSVIRPQASQIDFSGISHLWWVKRQGSKSRCLPIYLHGKVCHTSDPPALSVVANFCARKQLKAIVGADVYARPARTVLCLGIVDVSHRSLRNGRYKN